MTAAAPTASVDARSTEHAVGEVLRDIARGGIAGAVVGLLVAGLGGRLVMRAATILHEDAVGLRTENGEVIGAITLNGTLALTLFGGLGMGLLAGTIWVIVSPWVPGSGMPRALVTAVAAVALGTPPLVQRTNPDFVILDHDPIVVAMLVGLVGLVGLSIALVDDALDARLPHPRRRLATSMVAYVTTTLIGVVFVLLLAVPFLLNAPEYRAPVRAGWALAVVGACTLIWWVVRANGHRLPPKPLRLMGSVALLAAVLLGGVTSVPHLLGAAGLRS